MSDVIAQFDRTLDPSQAENISNYSNLYYRRVVTQSGETPPAEGTTFFFADAEAANMTPFNPPSWAEVEFNGTVSNVADTTAGFSRAYQFEVTNSGNPSSGSIGHDVRVMRDGPTVSMGTPGGGFGAGYYSRFMKISSGYEVEDAWNLTFGCMAGHSGQPTPIWNMGVEMRDGVLQAIFMLRNAGNDAQAGFTPPAIANYNEQDGWYFMTANSPSGIKPFPKNEWVHICCYTNFQASGGVFKMWQTNEGGATELIYDLTHANLNLFGGAFNVTGIPAGTNPEGDMLLQYGIYGLAQPGVIQRHRMYGFRVTDYQVVP